VARLLVALIFLMNASGVVRQERAAHELAATGIPAQFVPALMWAGRITQAIAGILLLIPNRLAVLGAMALAGFLIPATFAAHSFWLAEPNLWWSQLANFFKNVAMIGSLVVIAACYSRPRNAVQTDGNEKNGATLKRLRSA
jgi:putative oxidoreductase